MRRDPPPPEPVLRHSEHLRGRHLSVVDVVCRASRGGCGDEEGFAAPQLIIPRRGLFLFHLGRRELVADPNAAYLFHPPDGYRVSHPIDGGDECTVLFLSPQLLDEAFASGRRVEMGSGVPAKRFPLTPSVQLAAQALHSHGPRGEDLLTEELGFHVLAALRSQPAGRESRDPPEGTRFVERARALLASAPTENHSLESIGRAVRCSPFHLARYFKRETGFTLHGYLTRLRMAVALERLAQGEEDLARLALELGFAHHSHFSARFRQVFGRSPRLVRAALTRADAATMRRILTARPDAPR